MIDCACPCCGARGSLEMFCQQGVDASLMAALATMPSDCGREVFRYLRLFAPQRNKKISKDKALRLLNELLAMIKHGGTYRKKLITAPSHVWAQALAQTCDSLNAKADYKPLPSHNYLLQVVHSVLNGGQRAEDRGQKDEPKHIAPRTSSALQTVGEVLQPKPKPKQEPVVHPIPKDQIEQWLIKARDDLIHDKGLPEKGLLPFMIAHHAEALYNKELQDAR